MKRLLSTVMLAVSALAAGCGGLPMGGADRDAQAASEAGIGHAAAAPSDRIVAADRSGNVVVEKIEFRSGVSSATVERLAKSHGCTGSEGAGLLTEKGPVEVYRMKCDNGTTFMARCELRQCRPMR
jgi:predicted small secreted protein